MYKNHKIHFVGIGGIGMSGIAEVLLNLGYPVSGSDLKSTSITRRLQRKKAKIFLGHKKTNLQDVGVVVLSSAIKKDNPEVLEAEKKKIPIIQRAEMLAELMRSCRYGIAVAGSHGKTTTTSLIASTLYHGGIDPTMIIGGKVKSFKSNARVGKAEFMVAEADESDGSFLKLSPTIGVITSIDPEHLDYYQNFEEVKKAFLKFSNQLPFYGVVVCCSDHPTVKELIPLMEKRVITYGLKNPADIQARNILAKNMKTKFELVVDKKSQGEITLNMTGNHNVENALAAIAVAMELGINLVKVKKALSTFKGIERRLEILYQDKDYLVIDDYGHHPEEVKATLNAIKGFTKQRLVTFFQPHRYSRTKLLWSEFIQAFGKTDQLFLMDVYPAGEKEIEGVNSKLLTQAIQDATKLEVKHLPQNDLMLNQMMNLIQPGDVILTLGAGDITKLGHQLAKKLKSRKK